MALQNATWYIGWLGEMRALLTPEVGMDTTETRYGGTHQSLTGKRTIDITGYRTEYDLNWSYLTETEYEWLRALYIGHISQSQYIVNPLKKNLMSQQASIGKPFGADDLGIYSSGLTVITGYANDFPTGPVPAAARCFNLISTSATNNFIRFDGSSKLIPLIPGQDVTYSVYVRCETGTIPFNWAIDCFTKYGVQTTTPSLAQTATTSWQRITYTLTPSGDQAGTRMAFVFPTAGTKNLHIAAPQIEYASSVTDWELGGGSSKIIIDQLGTSSPRFPLTDVSATILEA